MTGRSEGPGPTVEASNEVPVKDLLETVWPLVEEYAGQVAQPPQQRVAPHSGIHTARRRRTKAAMADLRTALIDIVLEGAPMTVRQVYYQAVTRGLIEKTEQQYKAICRLLVQLRRDGRIAYDDIADNTRWMRKPRTYGSVEDALAETARLYRRQVWADLDWRVEVWLEKEALAGVLVDVTAQWDVPLMVTRGYPSLSFLHGAGEGIQASGFDTYIYYFGDHDPSGVDIARHVEEELSEFAGNVPVIFERVAVTRAQIEELDLPTRPTKKSDSRAKGWDGGSVEVDAIHPSQLRALAATCIEQHIPEGHMDVLLAAEASEREALKSFGREFLGRGEGSSG